MGARDGLEDERSGDLGPRSVPGTCGPEGHVILQHHAARVKIATPKKAVVVQTFAALLYICIFYMSRNDGIEVTALSMFVI